MEVNDFDAIRISLASPETIRSWSHGEVLKPETINYRTLRPERDGLFCEKIFGPTKDWECYCGKYKRVRYKGIKCDKCGVEVAPSRVRRERMGHIELASPVSHIWYVKGVPSRLGLLLNISPRNLERVLYFAQYIITKVDEDARNRTIQRFERDITMRSARLEGEAQSKIGEIEARRDERLAAFDVDEAEQRTAFDDRLARETDEVMRWTQENLGRLEAFSTTGKPAAADVTLPWNNDTLMRAGEAVTRNHTAELNKLVQERLSELESVLRQDQNEVRQLSAAKRDQARREAETEIAEIRHQIERQKDQLRAGIDNDLADLRALEPLELLTETRYRELAERWGNVFSAGMGAEAVREIVSRLDLPRLSKEMRHEIRTTRSKQRRKKAAKRLRVIESFRKSGNKPEWMILTVLPVIPPELRPMVQLDGGRFATSDLNDLYRRVINRNNRLRRLLELGAPDVIVRNEKRMLQEAVDSLIDNGRRGRAVSRSGKRKLKSLSDMLKGKQGRFRRNLLGKRVDYSGRSVIVIGPDLKLHQCGLPKRMALELFKPFVMRRLVEYNYAHNIKSAKRLVDRLSPEVWDVLEEVTKERPVLLNRAPTLHRLGIQAFEVVLIEGNAIQIHPLVCAAFNADFDGDQMAVHVPLSDAAVNEARRYMLSSINLLKPSSGEPIVGASKDMVLGCYYLTVHDPDAKGTGKAFSSAEEVRYAYDMGIVGLRAGIRLRWKGQMLETTVGLVLFNDILPDELRFVNKPMDKGALNDLVAQCYQLLGQEPTAKLVDDIKTIGFKFATRSGTTIAVSDINVPGSKTEIIDRTSQNVEEIERQFRRGLITEEEQYTQSVALWTRATDEITEAVKKLLDPVTGLGAMAVSGATKGGVTPIRQLAGMRGLMADPSGRIIDLPIRSNFREGLTALEYFLSTHGARKGLADTALRTADAGYLTRRLVDVAQDVIITEIDCGTRAGVTIDADQVKRIGEKFEERIVGRFLAQPVYDPKTGELIFDYDELINEGELERLKEAEVKQVVVRSPLVCQCTYGLCQHCYGRDLARGGLVNIGEAVGIIAAQSIGEPGTQLTLRTFHTGGVAGATDITQGLPRVEELFEARTPKGEAVITEIGGTVEIYWDGDQRKIKVSDTQLLRQEHDIPEGVTLAISDGDRVQEDTVIARTADGDEITAGMDGHVFLNSEDTGLIATVRREEQQEVEYDIAPSARVRVENGDRVAAGDQLTEGAKNPKEVLRIQGIEAVQLYMLEEVQRVYRSQGVMISDKHIEIIIRQMVRKVRVRTSGDTEFLPGELVDRFSFAEANARTEARGGNTSKGESMLLGVTKASLTTESFLAAASFQETTRVLTEAAVRGMKDDLRGLKENVIIGKLIPVGTGFEKRLQQQAAVRARAQKELAEGTLEEAEAAALASFTSDSDLVALDSGGDYDVDEAAGG